MWIISWVTCTILLCKEANTGIIRIWRFLTEEKLIFHIIDHIKVLRVPLWIWKWHFCIDDQLNLLWSVPFKKCKAASGHKCKSRIICEGNSSPCSWSPYCRTRRGRSWRKRILSPVHCRIQYISPLRLQYHQHCILIKQIC